jgi:hypothetical protein
MLRVIIKKGHTRLLWVVYICSRFRSESNYYLKFYVKRTFFKPAAILNSLPGPGCVLYRERKESLEGRRGGGGDGIGKIQKRYYTVYKIWTRDRGFGMI